MQLPTIGLAVGVTPAAARALDVALRTGDPPIVGRMLDDRLFLDCRTVLPHQIPALAAALARAALPIASS